MKLQPFVHRFCSNVMQIGGRRNDRSPAAHGFATTGDPSATLEAAP
jgi:hypothetical protein